MRFNRAMRRMITLGAVGFTALAWQGCKGSKVTELVAGVTSQVQVPRDFRSVRIDVNSSTGNVFCHTYPVYDGKVRLPRTLGLVAGGDPTFPVTISISGWVEDSAVGVTADGQAVAAFADCTVAPAVGNKRDVSQGGGARVIRRSRQPYVTDKILYLPMPLRYACYDVDCGDDQTCKGGQCVPSDLLPEQVAELPEYDDSLVFGSTNTCFRPLSTKDASGNPTIGCMDDALPPQVVDATTCTFVLPDTDSANAAGVPYLDAGAGFLLTHGSGLNVRVAYDNVVSEVLDYEGVCPQGGAVEGYCSPDVNKPQEFQLATGLCNAYRKGLPATDKAALKPSDPAYTATKHTISLLVSSGLCPPKTAYQPVCDDTVQGSPLPSLSDGGSSADGGCNALAPLSPAPSAFYVLMDHSTGMQDFFSTDAINEVLGVPLGDPAFANMQFAFNLLPAQQTDCSSSTNGYGAFDINKGGFIGSATDAKDSIQNVLNGFSLDAGATFAPGGDPWYLEAALDGAYTQLKTSTTGKRFNQLGAMLIIDRDFATSPTNCGNGHLDAITLAQQALQQNNILTYVIFLLNRDFPEGGVPRTDQTNAQQLTDSSRYFNATDPTKFPELPGQVISKIVDDFESCTFDAPPNVSTGATVHIYGNNPLLGQPEILAAYSQKNCSDEAADGTAPKWVFDNQRVRLCPNACQSLIGYIKLDQALTGQINAQNQQLGIPAQSPLGIGVGAMEPCDPTTPDPPLVEAGAGPTAPKDAGDVQDSGKSSGGGSGGSGDSGAIADAGAGGG